MADIELVIKMSENTYHRIQALIRDDYFEHDICGYSMQRIADGTPLPKGHGDLIDKNEIIKRYERDCGRRIYVENFIHDIELNVPTIIEEKKGENK